MPNIFSYQLWSNHTIHEYLAEECAGGRVIGPLQLDSYPNIHISPFGIIPKKATGKYRLIVDLPSPHDHSVNDGVAEDLSSLQYVTVEEVAAAMVHKGAGALLAKVDIKNAYRNIPIHPDEWWLFGMVWEDALFIDTTLPFGLRSAPKIFNAVADAVEWILKEAGVSVVFHYLDDFLLIGVPNSAECARLHVLHTHDGSDTYGNVSDSR